MDTEEPIKSAEENEHPSFTAGTTREVKLLAQEILKNGFIESATDAPGFNSVVRNHQNINAVLEPLDLRVDLDELRGLAVVCVVESVAADADEAWSHPLVRRQRLTLEQSLLVAILRQFYVVQEMESGIGVREVRVSLDELRSPLQVFLADTDAVCAGMCLGLDPTSEHATQWLAVAAGSPQAFYWIGRIATMEGEDVAVHPHALAATTELQRDPRWYYLWLRDVDTPRAARGVRELWPSPWAVELIVDLGLSTDLVLECYNGQTLDSKEPLQSAALLWAADYVVPNLT